MLRLNVVGFASGSPLSQMVMAAIARDHRLAAIVVPRTQGGIFRSLRRAIRNPINPLARFGVPLVDSSSVGNFSPDLIVVASFPHIISVTTLAIARLGALNMHSSLLPRHRGVDPIFWTYWDDDREAGVTIHWMTERVDAGDIATQKAFAFERGMASRELYMRLAACGTGQLSGLLEGIASGAVLRKPQDERRATYESAADIARACVPFAQWPAERVWHVLRGLGDQFSGLLCDPKGKRLPHGRATAFESTSDVRPGHIAFARDWYEVHCRDGIVFVDRLR